MRARVALLAGPVGAHGGDVVYAPKDCTKPKVEPKRITLACGDGGILLKGLGWSDWNADKVKGRGKLLVDTCDPNCASGGFDKYEAKVTLLNIKPTACGAGTVMMYNRAHVRFPRQNPPKPKGLRSFKLFCNG